MPENYKQRYEQMKKMVDLYQDEIVPGMRKRIEELEQNQVKVRCRECKHRTAATIDGIHWCYEHERGALMDDDFCSYGERSEGE